MLGGGSGKCHTLPPLRSDNGRTCLAIAAGSSKLLHRYPHPGPDPINSNLFEVVLGRPAPPPPPPHLSEEKDITGYNLIALLSQTASSLEFLVLNLGPVHPTIGAQQLDYGFGAPYTLNIIRNNQNSIYIYTRYSSALIDPLE